MDTTEEIKFEGAAVSEGIAIGPPYFLSSQDEESVPEFPIEVGEVDREISRYRKAIFSSREDLEKLQTDLKKQGSFEAITIIDTHLQMLDDPLMTTHVEEKIRNMQRNTEAVFRSVIKEFEKKFSGIQDSFFNQRFVDVKDVSKRILHHLCLKSSKSYTEIPVKAVIFAQELVPSFIAAIPQDKVSAFVTELGGGNSHAALIARSRGIPFVANIEIAQMRMREPKKVIVDGRSGEIILDPSVETLEYYDQEMNRYQNSMEFFDEEPNETLTIDGHSVSVRANISCFEEIDLLFRVGAQGVGLFRSEYLFFNNPLLFDDEEQQYTIYRQLAEAAQNLPIVIRVLDLGGDKNLSYFFHQQKEANPVLGCRGIRLLLRYKKLFRTQLRALIRATAHGNIHILLPLISDIVELRKSKELIEEIKAELTREGIPFNPDVHIGSMIEVPSAVLMCDALAEESDFLSIGTNDLVQYTLGIDRSNPLMNDFYFPAHPSVIRMIKMAVDSAKRHQKPIAICGEIASSKYLLPLLLGLGIQEFSCAPRYIPEVKKAIRSTSFKQAKELVEQILLLKTVEEISDRLQKNL
jgi:phosphotransferase system enzyme I (PtsI)